MAYVGGNSGVFERPFKNPDDSAELRQGSWSFDTLTWARANNRIPAFNYSGYLFDTNADGDWVYTRGKVDGFGWGGGASAENHTGNGTSVYVSQKVWGTDPPLTGQMQLCRHRASLIPNICRESGLKYSKQ